MNQAICFLYVTLHYSLWKCVFEADTVGFERSQTPFESHDFELDCKSRLRLYIRGIQISRFQRYKPLTCENKF